MKVIIELNEKVSIENNPDNEEEILIVFAINGLCHSSGECKIDDLKLALRKLTAK